VFTVLGWIIEIIGWIFMILRAIGIWASFSKDYEAGGLSVALWSLALNFIITLAIFIALVWLGRWLKGKGQQKA
jgi:hypothetical protein